MKERTNRYGNVLSLGIVFFAAIGFYSLDWFNGLGGGVSSVGAERVLNGEIPYRDFWTMYAPGHFYVLAALFGVFGTHLLVEVVAASVITAVAGCLCYQLAFNLARRKFEALACAGIFLAAVYNTGYFKSFGSYPTAMCFVLLALNLTVLYGIFGKTYHLAGAGVATAGAVLFKHDVGAYTGIAIMVGLAARQFVNGKHLWLGSTSRQFLAFAAPAAAAILPFLIYFAMASGTDMLRDLVVFPLTDFRFARPERFPSLVPADIYDEWRWQMLLNVFSYVNFTLPFLLFLGGVAAVGVIVRRRKLALVTPAVTFAVAFLLHYSAAHVQINTHIISMSVYAALLAIIVFRLARNRTSGGLGTRAVFALLAISWLAALTTDPAYALARNQDHVELQLSRASGFKLPAHRALALGALASFIDKELPAGREIFIGLQRHDVIIVGDVIAYFLLARPSATRYHELHPAVTDTVEVQHEIVGDLRRKAVPLIVTREMFSAEHLERTKKHFRENLPHIGATVLDEFIREHYVPMETFGSYTVWRQKGSMGRAG